MDSIYTSREAYEVDPNSSFNKLKKLQLSLKEEVALNDIYFENRDNLLKKIEKNSFEYFQNQMSIQEIYDHVIIALGKEGSEKKRIKYVVSLRPQNELPQCYDALYKLMFYFREQNSLTINLINNCPKENYETLANFICNFFYVNVFNSTFINENLLTLIYILLEKEVNNIQNISSFVAFLDPAQSFTSRLLRCLSRKDEVKVYIEKILKKLLIRTSGMLRSQNNNLFMGLDIGRIKNVLNNGKYNFERTDKKIVNIKELITSQINKSKLDLLNKSKNQNFNSKEMDKDNKSNSNSDDLYEEKEEFKENKELSKNEIENNIWVQVTKETFDDLLLGNEAKESEDDIFSTKNNYMQENNTNNTENDDLENYFINSGFFFKKQLDEKKKKKQKEKEKQINNSRLSMIPSLNSKSKILRPTLTNVEEVDVPSKESKLKIESNLNKDKEKNNNLDDELLYEDVEENAGNNETNEINELYSKELDKETLYDLLDKQNDEDMEEYLLNQIKIMEKDKLSFSNEKLISEIIKSSKNENMQEKIALAFKYNFQCIKEYLDEIFFSLIKNIDNIPYIIRAVCTVLSRLIKIKLPKITMVQIIPFLSEFIFTNLLLHILVNPKFNGIMMFDFSKDRTIHNERNKKIIAMNKVLKKLLRGQLFENSGNEYSYTLFNSYFIEIMPYVIEFFRTLTNVKLPKNIEILLEKKNISSTPSPSPPPESSPSPSPSIEMEKEFDFLKYHPEERIEHQAMCMNYKEVLMIYNIIKSNEVGIVGDPSGIIYKTYKKISFHEESIKKKMEKEESEGKRTYICMTKLVMDDKLKEKINEKKDKKFSFQEAENMNDSSKENFILQRVKFSINTIIKHLNVLKRTNFYIDENESTENFVIGLNKMISMEGFSEMLKEKTLPLEWFGLYLQSNIENIPSNYRRNNYSLLYNELIEESFQNLEKIKNDDSLNIIYNKIINSEKMIDISSNGLKRLTNNKKKFEIFYFILKIEIPIAMVVYYKKSNEVITKLEIEKDLTMNTHRKKLFNFSFKDENLEENVRFDCKNILEFCDFFPNLISTSEFIKDINEYEKEINLKKFLDEYFTIINEYIMKEEMFEEYEESEKKNIQQQIENYIHAQIYNKIFMNEASEEDNKIYEICKKYSEIKTSDINKEIKYNDDKMVQIMIYFVNNMLNEMCPANKMHEFEIIDMIIDNIMNIYGYDNKYYNILLLYVFIKAEPKFLDSNVKYITSYLDTDLKIKYESLIKKITELVKSLNEFNIDESNKN